VSAGIQSQSEERKLMQHEEILLKLKALSNPQAVKEMAKFGIATKNAYGISVFELAKIAKEVGSDHQLALKLWSSGIHEARILAALVDDPQKVTEAQMEKWVGDIDSWDVCDLVCGNLFDKTEFGWRKAVEWSERKEEFVKRAGFVLMAALAVHDKQAGDVEFLKLFPIIKRESDDDRNFVKKAVNWALKQIGKRNLNLNTKAVEISKEIGKMESKSAKWIASDALRELTSEKVQARLRRP
jgi:3-methyladenine DNA glycosylase AlkD